MGKLIDLTGMKFGRLAVISLEGTNANKRRLWFCRCDCGKEKMINGPSLRNGGISSCGCSRVHDIVGKRFGKLVVVRRVENKSYGTPMWECRCDCGNTSQCQAVALKTGGIKSCGCGRIVAEDLTGRRFNMLVVLYRGPQSSDGNIRWVCKCDCGKECLVQRSGLVSGNYKSCGCFRLSQNGNTKNPLWSTRTKMIARCHNPECSDYKYYGARGISVCQDWLDSFEKFFEDMGQKPSKKHSLERLDVNGNYEKSNCVWATMKQQCRNVNLTYNGQTKCAADWAIEWGLLASIVYKRIRLGWGTERIATTPTSAYKNRGKKV